VKAKALAIARLAVVVLLGPPSFAMGQGAEVSTIELTVGDNMRFTPSVIEATERTLSKPSRRATSL
jgi:hypothetical protein